MAKPIYKQIAEVMEQQILSGELAPGTLLPTEKELQLSHQASRVTVRKAMSQLVEADLVQRIRGSGTYVKEPRVQHNASRLRGFNEEIIAEGKQPSTRVVQFSLTSADPSVAEQLQLPEESPVYRVVRLRQIDGKPEIMEKTYLPLDLFPDLSIETMSGSKYDYIERIKGLTIGLSRQRLVPVIPREEVSQLLGIPPDQPVLKALSVGELANGRPFEYSVLYFRCEQFSFDVVSQRQPD